MNVNQHGLIGRFLVPTDLMVKRSRCMGSGPRVLAFRQLDIFCPIIFFTIAEWTRSLGTFFKMPL